MIAGKAFNDCFDVRFQPVLGASNKTKTLFEGVFNQHTALSWPQKNEFEELYNNHINLVNCFDDVTLPVLKPSKGLNDTWDACKKLGAYLYSSTIGQSCFKGIRRVGTSMNDHFKAFRESNGKVCCFCGCENYMAERKISEEYGNEGEDQWRASYDHYLAKKHYPFSSVDFDNLIPCCQTCNEKAKGEINLLEREGKRHRVFRPFYDAIPNGLTAKVETIDGFNITWTVDKLFLGLKILHKTYNWDNTFQVTARATEIFNDHANTSYFSYVLLGTDDATNARDALEKAKKIASSSVQNEREAYFKALCFEALINESDEVLEPLRKAVNEQFSHRVVF